jgi:glycosyltransferase involved in cell wall biosynthesis
LDRFPIAIVIPAYNEAATIASVVAAVRHVGPVFVVDDSSSDHTAELAEDAGAQVIRQPVNAGYDAALAEGFRTADAHGAMAVITMDADGQHRPDDVEKVASALALDHDLVIGVRRNKARLTEKAFAMLMQARWGVRDPLSGLKGYSIRLYRTVGFFDQLNSTGTELMIRALNHGFKAHQINIDESARLNETSRFGSVFKANARITSSLIRVLPLFFVKKG